ncbi:MAG: hypothetical protein WA002_05870 [Candidatus Acidiferrales bacterium]
MIMHSHFTLMLLFALLLSAILAGLMRATRRERIRYAARTFALFVGVGVVVAWLIYPLSH